MKRTAEKSLSIISAVLSLIGIIISVGLVSLFNFMKEDPMFWSGLEQELLLDPAIKPEDIEVLNVFFDLFGGTLWFIVIALIISLILTIVGIVKIWNDKNPKLAGILFIIAGVLAGFISIPSILLYIAGILCFTRKPPLTDKAPFTDDSYDGTMRPL
ncbi:DUF4064 domain-containing protein [Sporosarcina beigongshangi]|uniref:DUF4064 domain-containing protein n=1 Tax=Sporosarcina beigongshangi TaxID=2782538 RepID=UPI001939DE05|nr:DUF4064 domain-containing protein [Sporosarcina beigongshangi]